MIYYNQRDYPNVPYPSPSNKNATIKSGGCGVCCGAMIVANLAGQNMDIPAFAQYVMQNGARVSGGTDMGKLAKAICRDYVIEYETTNDRDKLLKHLAAGGMAIANVSGNRRGYTGVFSDSGHYIVVAGAKRNMLKILDPALYNGKFNIAGRKGKVAVEGNICKCDIEVLVKDVQGRTPSYYLFKKVVSGMEKVQDLIISVKGTPVTVKAVNVDGSNYVLLRDVPKLVPAMTVGYDAASKMPKVE